MLVITILLNFTTVVKGETVNQTQGMKGSSGCLKECNTLLNNKSNDTSCNKDDNANIDCVERSVVASVEFDKPTITKVGKYDVIQVNETYGWAGNVGAPITPSKSVNILLPFATVEIRNIDVRGTETEFSGSYRIIPQQPETHLANQSLVLEDGWIEDEKIYSSDKEYPISLYASDLRIQQFRGFKILCMLLHPIRYFPKTGEITYFTNMSISINVTTIKGHIDSLYRGLPQDFDEIENWIMNPLEIKTYPVIKDTPTTTYDYVIITDSSFTSTFQSLVDWKNSIGITTTIETVQNIESSYSGVDTQEKIRNYIIDKYSSWGIEYVLLGGDDDIIPHRGCYGYVNTGSGPIEDNDIPTDLYFGGLDGSWNNDGDSYWGEDGEEDLYAEVYVGRAPVSTSTEASYFVDKVKSYEQQSSGTGYLKSTLFVGEQLDDYPTWGGDYKDEIEAYFPVDYTITKLYERDATFSSSAVTNSLNSGEHIVNNMGHGNVHYIAGLYRSNVDALTNTKYFWWYSQSCYVASFDNRKTDGSYDSDDSIAEHFITNSNGGAVAFIGNSRYGWYSSESTSGTSQQFDKEFFNVLFNQNIDYIGQTLQKSKENLEGFVDSTGSYRWVYFELNLFGDPTLKIGGYPSGAGEGCNITYPSNGDTVSGTITITGTASEWMLPDLICEDIWVEPSSFSPGDTVTLYWKITNQGNVDAGAFKSKFYFDGTYKWYYDHSSLSAGSSITLYVSYYTWPSDYNSHALKGVADSENTVSESNEGNNERTEYFSASGGADLIVEDIWVEPSTFSPGDSVKLYAMIKNQGSDDVVGTFRTKRYFDGTYISYYDKTDLAAGATFTSYTTYTWPSDYNSHAIKSITDTENTVSESNEGNNERTEYFSATASIQLNENFNPP